MRPAAARHRRRPDQPAGRPGAARAAPAAAARATISAAAGIGEPCARRLAYEYLGAEQDPDRGFDGRTLRIFAVGHAFEDLTIAWLVAAGFELRTRDRSGRQFGFSAAGGRLRGHIDGVIVGGPEVGIEWPRPVRAQGAERARLERGARARRGSGQAGLLGAGPALHGLPRGRAHAVHRAQQEHPGAAPRAGARSTLPRPSACPTRRSTILRAADAGELPPRVAATPDHHACRFCPFPQPLLERAA